MDKLSDMLNPKKGKAKKSAVVGPRLVVEIDRETLNKFKAASTLNGFSMKKVILDYIQEYIK